ncbi:MAG TPA: hypothetical protein VF609_01860, partial [Flavisolibacter sp.]
MKRLFYSFTFLLLTTQIFATIRTVSNNPSTIAQFNTIQAAVNAAATGDTVYVHGSPNTYDGFTITNKQLVIIGPGWSPNKNLPHVVNVVGQVTLTGAGTTGTELQGLMVSGGLSIVTLGVNNIRLIRNRFSSSNFNITPSAGGTINGYLFEGNWFDNAGVNTNATYTLQNFIFQNNIFYETGCCISASIQSFVNTVNVLFDHNLFYGPSSGGKDIFTGNSRFLILTNNIFVHRNAANNLSSSTFNNNITFTAGSDAPWTVNGNVDGGGNVSGQDPQMAAQASVNSGANNPLLDFTITAGPANNSGSDGKDMGLLFDVAGSLN